MIFAVTHNSSTHFIIDDIKEINSGCICCSLVGDFAASIKEVIARFNPSRIIIEPSGVGKLSDIVNAIENKVNINPVLPAINASWRFIPNPKPTTEACNNIFVNILLCCINGLPIVKATTNPQNKAIAGERKGTIKRRIINIVSLVLCDNLSLIIECCVGKKQRFYRFTNQ